MRALLALALIVLAAPAFAQAPAASTGVDLFNNIWGQGVLFALLVLLVVAVFRFFVQERQRLVTALEKATADKESLLRETLTLARDNAEAFKQAKEVMTDVGAFVRLAHEENRRRADSPTRAQA